MADGHHLKFQKSFCKSALDLTRLDDVMETVKEGVQIHQHMRANPDRLRCYLTSCLRLLCIVGEGSFVG